MPEYLCLLPEYQSILLEYQSILPEYRGILSEIWSLLVERKDTAWIAKFTAWMVSYGLAQSWATCHLTPLVAQSEEERVIVKTHTHTHNTHSSTQLTQFCEVRNKLLYNVWYTYRVSQKTVISVLFIFFSQFFNDCQFHFKYRKILYLGDFLKCIDHNI